MVPNGIEFFEAAHGAGRLGRSSCRSTCTSRPTKPVGSSRDSGATAVVVAAELLPALEQVPDVPRLVVGDGYEEALAAAPDGEVERPT